MSYNNLELSQERQLRQAITEKWSRFPTGDKKTVDLLEGYSSDHERETMAILFENTMREVYENRKNSMMTETTFSSSSGSYEAVAFTMVRRVFASLLINEIATVQAATKPDVTLFYFKPEISSKIAGTDQLNRPTSGHASLAGQLLPACIGANCPDVTFNTDTCKSLYDRYYDDAQFDHSKGKYTIITATGQTIMLSGGTGCAVPASPALGNDGSFRAVKFAISGFDGSNPGTSPGHTARLGGRGGFGLEIDSQEFLASFAVLYAGATPLTDNFGNVMYRQGDMIPFRLLPQKYGKNLVEYYDFCDADGNLLVELEFSKPLIDCDICPTVDGFTGLSSGTTITPTSFAFVWRRYEDLEGSSEFGQVTFTIEKTTIPVKNRALAAQWTPQLLADVQAYHQIDAEAELTNIMSQHVALEIDREALLMMKRGAAFTSRWDYLGWRQQGSQKYTIKEWNQTLITKINQISFQIHKSTLQGGANFLVVSAEVAALFDDLEQFAVSNAEPGSEQFNLGMRRSGTLAGRYKVYVDPYAKAGDILIGHKGTSILDTGFIYAPYVPIALSNVIQDPNNFTFKRQLSTRYAMSMVNNRYYGYIKVYNIPTFDTNELR